MTKRYFKSTDGTKTIFRASERHYQFGRFSRPIGFCNTPGLDRCPAHEITKAEYDRLIALKRERQIAAGENLQYSSGPQDSWVANIAIPMPFVPTAEELERINNPPPVGEG